MARKTQRPAKAKAAPRRKATKPPNDTPLIKECVVYAQSVAAAVAGFEADPDGNNKHAAQLSDRHNNRASQALTKIATMTASTPEGLQSKARILPMVIDDSCGSMEDADEAFYRSFAADVKKFLETIIHDHFVADLAAKKGKVAS
jgi:hypothetical protein